MNRITAVVAGCCFAVGCAQTALAGDWIFNSGDYTRSATTGKRVDQYEKLPEVDRIPFEKFFSEDGPHPFGLDYFGYGFPYEYGYGGTYPWLEGEGEYGWGGYPYGIPYVGMMGTP